jgi:hypothetical protein
MPNVQLTCLNNIRKDRNKPRLGLDTETYYSGLEVKIDGEAFFVPTPFAFSIVEKRWVKIPISQFDRLEFAVSDTGMTLDNLKAFLTACNNPVLTSLNVYTATATSGTSIELPSTPAKVYLAFIDGQLYEFTVSGKDVIFTFDIGLLGGSASKTITIVWV